jgi:hypothetical protein
MASGAFDELFEAVSNAAPQPVVGWRRTILGIVRPTASHGHLVGLAAISRGSAPPYQFRSAILRDTRETHSLRLLDATIQIIDRHCDGGGP